MSEDKNRATIGQRIFSEIDSDQYLNKLYSYLLFNYALKLFSPESIKPKEINYIDALRFADLLSKSNDPKKAESHHTWAQEIVALVKELQGDNPILRVYMDSILLSTGNYQGLDLQEREHKKNDQTAVPRYDLLEQFYQEHRKEDYAIPSDPDKNFFHVQKGIYYHFHDQYLSYSAPTSLGKSYLMRLMMKERIQKGEKLNFALLVPTKALINEVTEKLTDELAELLQVHDYRIVNSAGALSLKDKTHNFIFVVTPERMLYIMSDPEAVKIDYIFVDEAHKISERDGRSAFYYKIIQMAVQDEENPSHVIFAAPSIANPEVFFQIIPDWYQRRDYCLATRYAPVSQEKFIVDFRDHGIFAVNDRKNELMPIAPLPEDKELISFITDIGKGKRNIIYCSGRESGIKYACEYADQFDPLNDPELDELAKEIEETIHEEYHLARIIRTGVAYHMGYLPTTIRLRIEELYKNDKIHTVFCTRTLLEGVNLPADNLFITSKKSGGHELNAVDFRNLVGRVGRIEFNLYGNVFLLCLKKQTKLAEFEKLVKEDIPSIQLSVSTAITPEQKAEIVQKLSEGEIPVFEDISERDLEKLALNSFARKAVNMLVHDIVKGKKSRIVQEFKDYLTDDIKEQIREQFKSRAELLDDDINTSVIQNERLKEAILKKQIPIPPRNATQPQILAFLEKLCDVFLWEQCEKFTLGYQDKDGNHSRLRWYAKLVEMWVSGRGIRYIVNDSLKRCEETGNVYIYGMMKTYEATADQKNHVISSVLEDIDKILLFRLSNYFLRLSSVYKALNGEPPNPDWYEFVEYGSIYPMPIFLQRNGFSRESAMWIVDNNAGRRYVDEDKDGNYVLHIALLECSNQGARRDAKKVYYNIRELFVD